MRRIFTGCAAIFLCIILLSSGIPVFAQPSMSLSVSAESAILIEAESKKILFEKNAHEKRGIASTTKIMTALVALENSDLDEIVQATTKTVGVEGSSIYLHAGEELSMEDLLYALLLESANDAAATIAYAVAGSEDAFAGMMNDKAAELGLSDSSFVNPHGLDAEGHYSTAYDLAMITAAALQNEKFHQMVSTYRKVIENPKDQTTRLLLNHNKLLKTYEGAIGVKTGYTKRCGRCLVSAAERDGLRLIAVSLNASDDWNDHRKMLDYGFSTYEKVNLLAEGEVRMMTNVVGGERDKAALTNVKAVGVMLPKEHGEITSITELSPFYYAPLKSGQNVGKIRYFCDGECIAEAELFSLDTVEKAQSRHSFWNWICKIFGFGA